jgi:hypothetical protein
MSPMKDNTPNSFGRRTSNATQPEGKIEF